MTAPDRLERVWINVHNSYGWNVYLEDHKHKPDDAVPYILQSELDAANAKIAELKEEAPYTLKRKNHFVNKWLGARIERDKARKDLEEARKDLEEARAENTRLFATKGLMHLQKIDAETERDAALAEVKLVRQAAYSIMDRETRSEFAKAIMAQRTVINTEKSGE